MILLVLVGAVASWFLLRRPRLISPTSWRHRSGLLPRGGPVHGGARWNGATGAAGGSRWLSNGIWPAALGQPTPMGEELGIRGHPRPAGNIYRSATAGDWTDYFAPLITNASERSASGDCQRAAGGAVDCGVCGSARCHRVFIGAVLLVILSEQAPCGLETTGRHRRDIQRSRGPAQTP